MHKGVRLDKEAKTEAEKRTAEQAWSMLDMIVKSKFSNISITIILSELREICVLVARRQRNHNKTFYQQIISKYPYLPELKPIHKN